MFTKNYKTWQKMVFNFENFAYFKDAVGVSIQANVNYCVNANMGRIMKVARCTTASMAESSSSSKNGLENVTTNIGLYFGSGSTAPTEDDYALENMITSGLSIANGSVMVNDEDGVHTVSVSHMLTNTSSEEIVVREVGAFGEVGRYSNSKYYYHLVLFERTVLTDPMVIPAGKSKMVNYVLTFNQPSQ